jgi:hypothetical protein
MLRPWSVCQVSAATIESFRPAEKPGVVYSLSVILAGGAERIAPPPFDLNSFRGIHSTALFGTPFNAPLFTA